MRILMCCPNIGPDRPLRGGAERQTERLAMALQTRGHTVDILTLRESPLWPLHDRINGINTYRIPVSNLSQWMRRGSGIPNTILRRHQIRDVARGHILKADVVHCHLATAFSAAVAAQARSLGKPVLCKVASGGDTFDLVTLSRTTVIGALIVRSLLRNVDRWISLSGEIRADLLNWKIPADRIVSIPNSVELVAPPLEPLPDFAHRFLFLARFTRDRDIRTLLTAFDLLHLRFPNSELALVGGGPLDAVVRRDVAALTGRHRVQIFGYGDAAAWLKWAHVVVQPSLYEGMSNTLLEAMAAGRACIASNISPNRELLDDGALGLLFPAGDVTALASAMVQLSSTKGAARNLGAVARRAASDRYDIQQVVQRYESLYESL